MRGMQLKFDEFYGEKIIPENDSVRMVERIVKEMDLSSLYATYSNMGRPPATSADTLLMVMLYACMEGKYSSREIESACNRDINYIWLLNGEEAPNYHEICRFRSYGLQLEQTSCQNRAKTTENAIVRKTFGLNFQKFNKNSIWQSLF